MNNAVQISAISGVPDIKPGDKLDKILEGVFGEKWRELGSTIFYVLHIKSFQKLKVT